MNRKGFFLGIGWLLLSQAMWSQTVAGRLSGALTAFEKDAQLKHALISLYVVDAGTGEVVLDKNSGLGLAPASTQKIITSVTAFELMGKDYRYATDFGVVKTGQLATLYIKPSGDPTLGSWRWAQTREEGLLSSLAAALRAKGVSGFDHVLIDTGGWEGEQIPDGWIWQDIGNYYGAGAAPFNWRENQYDLFLRSGSNTGDPVTVVKTEPRLYFDTLISTATAGPRGSGDNAYIYLPAGRATTVVRGTIPSGETGFRISGSMTDPAAEFAATLSASLGAGPGAVTLRPDYGQPAGQPEIFLTANSPGLDSIIYWFNKKSINLYGEALLKTMAFLKEGKGSTSAGVKLVRGFWKGQGLDEDELRMVDGSGLSPLNRVTTHAQVTVLKFARNRSWFSSFFEALPEYNGMKMKSGTISGAKGFCGYQRGKDGRDYIFSFLVNNYSGSAGALVSKMYRVLDELK